jgi:REP element-mobilizing transposase RayT
MPLQPFDPQGDVRIYCLNLPHWRQPGATYFLTTRLADSIPQNALSQWRYERDCWLNANGCKAENEINRMPENARVEFHRRFTARFHALLDAGDGACLLRKSGVAKIVADALRFFDGKRYRLGDFVIMPNHIHVLVAPAPEHELKNIVRSWKGFSARQINRLLGRTGAFWQSETYDHIVRSEEQFGHYRGYIANNPVKARLKEGEYVLYRAQ